MIHDRKAAAVLAWSQGMKEAGEGKAGVIIVVHGASE
jgi:hypothetical protein